MSNIDKRALREAAERATLGRIGDRIDGSGSIKYQCFGNDGSLVLQADHKNMEYGFIGVNSEADELFFRLCDPAAVLALLDELEAAGKRIIELEQKCENDPRIHEIIDLKERIAGLEAEKAELRQVEPDGWITDSDKWEKEGVAAAYKKLFRESPIPQDIPFYFAKPQSAAAGIGKGE